MKLIMEGASLLTGSFEDEMNESTGNTERNYYISGTFSTPEAKNRNGRIYSRNIWEREVAKYQKEINERSVNTLGEWQHPPRSTVDPLKAVLRIVELKLDETGNVVGRAKILNNNTEATNSIKGLIKEGIKIGVSSRGVGKVSATGIVEDFKLITYDAVDMPSDYNAMLNGVVEGHQIVEGIVQDVEYSIDENDCIVECSLETPEVIELALEESVEAIEEKIFNGKAKIGKKIVTMPIVAKNDAEAEKNFIKRIENQQKNGHVPKGKIEDIIFESSEEPYKNVSILKELLAEADAEKLCDLSLEEKEIVLSAFSDRVLNETKVTEMISQAKEEIYSNIDTYLAESFGEITSKRDELIESISDFLEGKPAKVQIEETIDAPEITESKAIDEDIAAAIIKGLKEAKEKDTETEEDDSTEGRCSECGKEIDEDEKICDACEEKVEDEEKVEEKSETDFLSKLKNKVFNS